jgi:glycerophosphoryl diester phosphodiesterase
VMVSCELRWLEAETVERCHAEGIKVISWTVNTDEELALARELGLDGVVTDLPEIKTAAQQAA